MAKELIVDDDPHMRELFGLFLRPEAVVTIADTGMGIAEGYQEHIFERFYKVDKSCNRTLSGSG